MKNYSFFTYIRAIAFALVLNFPYIYEAFQWGFLSIRNFEFDEYHYLPQAFALASGHEISTRFYLESDLQPVGTLLLTRPNAWLDIVSGQLGQTLNLTPIQFGLLLDIAISFICYIIFSNAFRHFTSAFWAAEAATIVFLGFPQGFAIWHFFEFTHSHAHLATPESLYTPTPVLRALYTQVSYLLFGLALLFFGRSIKQEKPDPQSLYFCSIISGLQCYVYFFAWISGIFIFGGGLAVAAAINFGRTSNKPPLRLSVFLTFLAFFILTSIPGVLILYLNNTADVFSLPSSALQWNFSTSNILTILISIAFCLYTPFNSRLFWPLAIFLSAAVSEFCLPNLQPLFGKFLATFWFQIFYIYPTSWAFFTLIALSFILQNLGWRSFATFAYVLLAIRLCYGSIMKFESFTRDTEKVSEIVALANYINSNTKASDVLAINSFISLPIDQNSTSFPVSPMPLVISALTARNVLHQSWAMPADSVALENFQREMLLSWVLSNKFRLVWPCDSINLASFDALETTAKLHAVRRFKQCSDLNEELNQTTVCKTLKKYQVDYSIIDRRQPLNLIDAPFSTPVWTSPLGRYIVLKFNSQDALDKHCH